MERMLLTTMIWRIHMLFKKKSLGFLFLVTEGIFSFLIVYNPKISDWPLATGYPLFTHLPKVEAKSIN